MAELNQTVVESSNPKPQLRFNSEELGLKVKRFIEEDQRLRSQGSSFSPSTIPSSVTDTLTGGDGNDTLNGGDSNDLIDGKNGNDLLDGKGGNDAIAGGRGDDTVIGGSGDDSLYGELAITIKPNINIIATGISSSPVTEGKNYLDGGDGDDILGGGGNHDTLMGGNGDDYLYGGSTSLGGCTHVYDPYGEYQSCRSASGNDSLTGGDGNDTLDGAEGADTLIGESGHDLITGGYGNDSLTGGDGNDTLRGGSDSDTLTGGAGADMFSFRLLFLRSDFTRPTVGSQLTGAPKPERGIDTIEDFNAEEGDKIEISGFRAAAYAEVSLSQFHYNQGTGILSFENKEFAQLQPGADFIVDRDVILNINSDSGFQFSEIQISGF